MQAHEERVVVERKELFEKGEKLQAFVDGDSTEYRQTPLMEKERLGAQLFHMKRYIAILDDRIAYFKE